MRKRKHSPEFREQAVKQTLTGDESIKDIAAGLGISYWTLQDWRREYLESQKSEPETRKKSSAEEELKCLRAENASLRMGNTILKKYAAMLSRDD
ncbi:transposase [Leptonema illini]|uniref:Transposase IS3/IS911 family protein n=1 Tax=Leptonema illini DSM 21528 TaxID=929563 RepID=H2CD59_9LEPT|nr:transposase [Leptonema illini]EHQ07535.1 transposase IS3/IS911 family protein [Leptonema illini DSM 21528]